MFILLYSSTTVVKILETLAIFQATNAFGA